MPQDASYDFDRQTNTLFIHFDVEEHHIKLDTFIQTADSARRIIAAIDQSLFGSNLDFEIVVLPPEEGTFLQKLKVILPAAAAAVLFLDSATPSGFIEGLTGKAPSEWAKELGELGQHAAELVFDAADADELDAHLPELNAVAHKHDEILCNLGEAMLTAMTRNILERDIEQLKSIGMEEGTLIEALDARADFYSACFDDGDVRRVGFTPDDDFPVPRSSFAGRAQKPVRKEDEEDPPEWAVAIESINVTSPNWVEEDQRLRQWKGKDASGRDCYFVVEDAEFWRLVKRKDLHVEVWDSLKVQWAYRVVDGKAKQRRVLRVLEFNGTKLATPLTAGAINAILGSHTSANGAKSEPDLFDWQKDS
jgi:hypothetical protein